MSARETCLDKTDAAILGNSLVELITPIVRLAEARQPTLQFLLMLKNYFLH